MVAHDAAPPAAAPSTVVTEGSKLRAARWFLEGKLARRTGAEVAGEILRVCVVRAFSAAACLSSMLLAAWVGAFAQVITAHGWSGFRALDGKSLLLASAQASRYQGDLVPVLICWAALLLLTPTGYALAWRAAPVTAGVLGFLEFSPPSFPVTTWVGAMSRWLVRFDYHWRADGIAVFIASVAAAYVLQSYAPGVFLRLGRFRSRPGRRSLTGSGSGDLVRRACATLLVLLVLLLVTWVATVVRLAASHPGTGGLEMSFGFQGGLYQSKYLLVLAFIAVCLAQAYSVEYWLIVAAALTACYGLAPHAVTFPSMLEFPVGRGELTRLGAAWGAGSLWAALFLYVPAVVLGIYLTARLRGRRLAG
jgi:hypothetical protein